MMYVFKPYTQRPTNASRYSNSTSMEPMKGIAVFSVSTRHVRGDARVGGALPSWRHDRRSLWTGVLGILSRPSQVPAWARAIGRRGWRSDIAIVPGKGLPEEDDPQVIEAVFYPHGEHP